MKNLLLSLILSCVGLSASAQNASFDELLGSMQAGKITMITNLFTDPIDLIILGDERSVDKATGVREVNTFFKKYPLSVLDIIHYSNRENSSFIISKYKSGDSFFRMYLLLKKSNDRVQVSQIRIEKTFE